MDLQPVNKLESSQCPKTFKTKDNLKNHVITHDPDANVKCEICGKVLETPHALSAHKRAHNTTKEGSICDTCHQVFPNPTNLRDHMKSVHSGLRFPCTFPGCEKAYKNKGDVPRHMQTEHAENPVRFPCTVCGREFKRRGHLKQHIPIHFHTTAKPYNCATCGRTFTRKGNLKSHEMTHLDKSAGDISKCHICRQTFPNWTDVQRHIRVVHEYQRSYPCAFCDKRFFNPFNLKVHVEAEHSTSQDQVHSCDKCEFKTYSEDYLALHGKRHEPGNHECDFFGKKFVTFHEYIQRRRINTLEKLF